MSHVLAGTFLGRLAGKPAAEPDVLRSVLDNLRHVLSTVRGYGSGLPGYGLTVGRDEAPTREAIEGVVSELRETIARYEPRLRLGTIEVVRAHRALTLKLSGTVEGAPLTFAVRAHPDGLTMETP